MATNNVIAAVLNIPETAIDMIDRLEKKIDGLAVTSQTVARLVAKEFETTIPGGVQASIDKVEELRQRLESLPAADFKAMLKAEQAASDLGPLSSALGDIASKLGAMSGSGSVAKETVDALKQGLESMAASVTEKLDSLNKVATNTESLLARTSLTIVDINSRQAKAEKELDRGRGQRAALQDRRSAKEIENGLAELHSLEQKEAAMRRLEEIMRSYDPTKQSQAQEFEAAARSANTLAAQIKEMRQEYSVFLKGEAGYPGADPWSVAARSVSQLRESISALRREQDRTSVYTGEWAQLQKDIDLATRTLRDYETVAEKQRHQSSAMAMLAESADLAGKNLRELKNLQSGLSRAMEWETEDAQLKALADAYGKVTEEVKKLEQAREALLAPKPTASELVSQSEERTIRDAGQSLENLLRLQRALWDELLKSPQSAQELDALKDAYKRVTAVVDELTRSLKGKEEVQKRAQSAAKPQAPVVDNAHVISLEAEAATAASKSLSELIDLQNRLWDAIQRGNRSDLALMDRLRAAYMEIGKEINNFRDSFREAKAAASGISARPMQEIVFGDTSLQTLEQLKADYKQLKEHIAQTASVEAIHTGAMKAETDAAQRLAMAIAYIERETKGLAQSSAEQAALTRVQENGLAHYQTQVQNASTTLAQLIQNEKDLAAALKHMDPSTREWGDFNKVAKETKARVKALKDELKITGSQGYRPFDDIRKDLSQANLSLADLIRLTKEAKAALSDAKDRGGEWSKLNESYKEGKKRIDDIKRAMGDLREETKKAESEGGKLNRTLRSMAVFAAQYFSLQAVTGFLRKMVDVHAQFELQRVSLASLIQSKEQADEMFSQVQAMAMRSPFSILQLTTYTKQLAAYRVETEKLLDTTKMLADVSAGLGVDMGRLILAYGQVKSANYLRATEVRQFTEAGMNISGELAKYFSELRGEMVSVADVTEMITKRLVKFEDVEEVFRRVTSAGGLFYDMQKKQSETVHGQMQRIQDAYGIMMDEIGKGNSSAITGVLTMIRSMLGQWRAFATEIKYAIYALGAYKTAVLLASLSSTKWHKAIVGLVGMLKEHGLAATYASIKTDMLSASGLRLRGVLTALGTTVAPIAVLTAIAYALHNVIQRSEESKARLEELMNIENETLKGADDAVSRYKALASVVRNVASSTQQRQEALDELSRTYGEYLPKQMLDEEGIRGITDGYAEATATIRQHYAELARHRKETYFQGEFDKKLQSAIASNADIVKAVGLNESEMQSIIQSALEEALRKGIGSESEALLWGEVNKKLTDYLGDGWKKLGIVQKNTMEVLFTKSLPGLISALENIKATQNEVLMSTEGMTQEQAKQRQEQLQTARKVQKLYDDEKKKVEEVADALSILFKKRKEELNGGASQDWDRLTEELARLYKGEWMGNAPTKDDLLGNILSSKEDMETEARRLGQSLAIAMAEGVREKFDTGAGIFQNLAKTFYDAFDSLQLSSAAASATRYKDMVRSQFGDAASILDRITINPQSTISGMRQEAKGIVDSLKSQLQAYENSVKAGNAVLDAQKTHLDGKTAQQTKENLKAAEKFWRLMGGGEKNTTGTGRGNNEWNTRLSLLTQVNTEYNKLCKYYTEEQAHAKVMESYSDTAAKAFAGIDPWQNISEWGGADKFGDEKTVERLRKLAELAGTQYAEQFLKAASKIESELGIERQKKATEGAKAEVEKLMQNYELTKTLGETGLSVELAAYFGGEKVAPEDVAQRIAKIWNNAITENNLGSEAYKAKEDALNKWRARQAKNSLEQAKKYNELLLQTLGERAQIRIKASREEQRIMADESLDTAGKKLAVQNVRNQEKKDLDKQAWEEFKSSGFYLELMQNAASMSAQSIDMMLEKLEGLKNSLQELSPENLKVITSEINKLRERKAELRPFKAWADDMKTAAEYMEKQKQMRAELKSAMSEEDGLKAQLMEKEELAEKLRQEALAAEGAYGKFTDQATQANIKLAEVELVIDAIKKKLADLGIKIENIVDNQSKGENALSRIPGDISKANTELDGIQQGANGIIDSLDSMGMLSESFLDTWKSINEAFDAAQEVATGIGTAIQGFGSGNYLQMTSGISGIVSGLFKFTASLFNLGDKRKQRQIERLKDKVQDLSLAYDQLSRSIERAYKFDDYVMGSRQAKANLEEQIEATEQMLALEKSKKKSDKDFIRECEEEIQDLKNQIEDLEDETLQALGGFGQQARQSTAESFAQAWLESFNEVGDGIDALRDKWDEMMDNLILKQLSLRVAGKRLQALMDLVDSSLSEESQGGESLTKDELAKISELREQVTSQLNDELQQLAAALGYASKGASNLSDLQQGISGITANQAAALESITNSIRFAVWQQIECLEALLAEVRRQYGATDSPVVVELKGIRGELADIKSLFKSVVKQGSRIDGRGYVKVD